MGLKMVTGEQKRIMEHLWWCYANILKFQIVFILVSLKNVHMGLATNLPPTPYPAPPRYNWLHTNIVQFIYLFPPINKYLLVSLQGTHLPPALSHIMPTLCARIAGADGVGFAQILHKIHSKTEFSRRFGDGKNSI